MFLTSVFRSRASKNCTQVWQEWTFQTDCTSQLSRTEIGSHNVITGTSFISRALPTIDRIPSEGNLKHALLEKWRKCYWLLIACDDFTSVTHCSKWEWTKPHDNSCLRTVTYEKWPTKICRHSDFETILKGMTLQQFVTWKQSCL